MDSKKYIYKTLKEENKEVASYVEKIGHPG